MNFSDFFTCIIMRLYDKRSSVVNTNVKVMIRNLKNCSKPEFWKITSYSIFLMCPLIKRRARYKFHLSFYFF